MKCDICNKKIQQTFLNKPLGSYIKDKKGEKRIVCQECQSKLKTKEEILAKL